MLGQKVYQAVHAPQIGTVEEISSLPAAGYELGIDQFPQMERQSRCRHAETPGEVRRRVACRSAPDEEAEDRQARFGGERAQGDDRIM